MNTYSKYVPNVFLAKSPDHYEKGQTIEMQTKYGKIHECIVFNLVYSKDGFNFYSIVRADGYNVQERAKAKAARLEQWAGSAEKKSLEFYEASKEGRDFLALGEPIKVGHHSEKRHRALIDRNWNRMGKSVEMSNKAEKYLDRADYWEKQADVINLSMPESLEYFQYLLEQAEINHQGLKDGTIERRHSMSMQYSNKKVKELKDKVKIAEKMWS